MLSIVLSLSGHLPPLEDLCAYRGGQVERRAAKKEEHMCLFTRKTQNSGVESEGELCKILKEKYLFSELVY